MTFSARLAAFSALALYILTIATTPATALAAEGHAHSVRNHHAVIVKHRRDGQPSSRLNRRCEKRTPALTTLSLPAAPTSSPPKQDDNTPPKDNNPPPKEDNPPPAPSPSPQPQPQPQPPAPRGGKAGMAWSYGNVGADVFGKLGQGKVSWLYSWSSDKPSNAGNAGLDYVPMLWGRGRQGAFRNFWNNNWSGHALFINEPDMGAQANMGVGEAVGLWWSDFQWLKEKGVRLGSPAVASGPEGKRWLQDFFNQCGGCTIDFVAVHWYGLRANEFIAYLEDFHRTFNRPIWVTEFAVQDFVNWQGASKEEISSFLEQTTNFMDSQWWVERYAWLGYFPYNLPDGVNWWNKLVDGAGYNPTDLGYQYMY